TVLGTHPGIHRFTVGQRRGLGVNGPEPRYVQEIDPQSRRVVVGPAAEGSRQTFRISGTKWVDAAPSPDQAVEVKIRHRHRGAAARVRADGTSATVEMEAPAWAVTPGQAAVFYDRDRVLGGGWIC
ncbi:MAG TPA: aminomethyltransferase beta-barrel domain-containing protein, partial [Myxococcaceae bacterium]|nr:aminomethyltransferase beta-barrel domain-containing protein [Myxococcaceae bacterium]